MGPLLVVVVLIGKSAWGLTQDARRVEGLCWEKVELQERARGEKKVS